MKLRFIIFLFFISFDIAFAETSTKYDSLRIEAEMTYDVPLEKADEVWSWLQTDFKNGWQTKGTNFKTFNDIENFVDTYFDTPELSLSKLYAGLRHRRRFFPDGAVKELIQLKQPYASKLNIENAEGQLRGEIKFELRMPTVVGGPESVKDSTSIFQLIKNSQKNALVERMLLLNVEAKRLSPLLTIRQERKRVYFRENDKQFFTVTLDLASSRKLWLSRKFAQLDIEIGEIAFTEATPEFRQRLLDYQAELQSALLKRFPELIRNQTPKIVMMLNKYQQAGMLAKLVIRFGEWLYYMISFLLFIIVLCFIGSKKKRLSLNNI
jgi:CYTH domain